MILHLFYSFTLLTASLVASANIQEKWEGQGHYVLYNQDDGKVVLMHCSNASFEIHELSTQAFKAFISADCGASQINRQLNLIVDGDLLRESNGNLVGKISGLNFTVKRDIFGVLFSIHGSRHGGQLIINDSLLAPPNFSKSYSSLNLVLSK